MTNRMVKPLLLVALVMVLPLVLLGFAGESFASFVEEVKNDPPSPALLFLTIVGILASDIFLPVPSGPVSTLAGSQLGIPAGTLASALGMTIGNLIAFTLARRWGRPLVLRLTDEQQLRDCQTMADTFGTSIVLITRPLPVLAEAAVLLMGTLQMNWKMFLPILIASNILIAGIYASVGSLASDQDWLVLAVCLSVALPVFLVAGIRRIVRKPKA